jgi:methylated-DNA-[protein]-cysteine S-methyltransferase
MCAAPAIRALPAPGAAETPETPETPQTPETSETIAFDLFPAPTAQVLAVARGGRLVRLDQLPADAHPPAGSAPATGRAAEILARHHPGARHDPEAAPLPALRRQLAEYFAGRRRAFELPLAPAGTAFERRVWAELEAIPYGETRSYAEVAAAIGRAAACRAVGRANGRNPISIVIPCHRVIGSDGSLTGYGGGLPIKRFLLRLEGAEVPAAGAAADGNGRQLGLPI